MRLKKSEMDVVKDVSIRRGRFRNGSDWLLTKTSLADQNIDDNYNAFRLIKQLNTFYTH